MLKTRDYLFHHLAAPFTAMLILIAGAFIVYKGCYTGTHRVTDLALMEPAAGKEDGAALKIRFEHKELWQ